jgi:serine/threonine protein kinase
MLASRGGLHKTIHESNEITEIHTKAIILELLSTLADVHDKDISYRDTILEKIFTMLDNIPNVALEDFGCTIHINHETHSTSDDTDTIRCLNRGIVNHVLQNHICCRLD